MTGRFPPDLFAVVFGPVIVLVIAVGLGSVIFRADQIRGSVAAYGIIAGAVVALLVVLLFWSRRRR
jgi:membrane associated rhomboid family serine protease